MQFLRRTGALVAGGVFLSFLFLAIVLTSVNSIVTHPDSIKSWLRESKIYDSAVAAVLEKSADTNKSNEPGSVPLNDPNIKAIATQAFSPQLLQQSSENFITGMYSWLDGKTATPNFSIDFSNAKSTFATKVGDYLRQRTTTLPACTAFNVPESFDPFTVECLPPGINTNAEIDRVVGDISGSKDFLSDPKLTNDTLTVDKDGTKESISQAYQEAPTYYKKLKTAPYVAGLVSILAAAAVFVLSASHRKAIRRIATTLGVVGGLLLISTIFVTRGITALKDQVSSQKDSVAALQQAGTFLLDKVGGAINHTNIVFGITFVVLSIAGFAYLYFTHDKSTHHEDTDKHEKPHTPASTPGIV
jgi:hypothetical protein